MNKEQDCHILPSLLAKIGTGDSVKKKEGILKLHQESLLNLTHVLCLRALYSHL